MGRAILDLVTLDLLVPFDRLAGIAIHILPFHAVTRLAVDDVERDFLRRGQSGIKTDFTVQITKDQMAFPARPPVHDARP